MSMSVNTNYNPEIKAVEDTASTPVVQNPPVEDETVFGTDTTLETSNVDEFVQQNLSGAEGVIFESCFSCLFYFAINNITDVCRFAREKRFDYFGSCGMVNKENFVRANVAESLLHEGFECHFLLGRRQGCLLRWNWSMNKSSLANITYFHEVVKHGDNGFSNRVALWSSPFHN